MNKKSIVSFWGIVALCMMPIMGQAQVDTLYGQVPYFHYNYYDSSWCRSQVNQGVLYYVQAQNVIINKLGSANRSLYYNEQQGRGFWMCSYRNDKMASEVAIRMEMDSVLDIKGLAFGYNYVVPDSNWYEPVTYNTLDFIFNIYDENMNRLWSDTIPTSDMQIDHYMEAGFNVTTETYDAAYRQWYSSTGEFNGFLAPAYIGLCYVMFDTTIQVPETVYIGITSSSPINILQDTSLTITTFLEHYHSAGDDSLCCMPYESRRYRIAQGSEEAINDWEEEECHYGVQTCLYPILDMPCDDVTGLYYESVGSAGTMAFVQWDDNPKHTVYEVSYGIRGTPAGAGTIVTTHAPRFIQTLDRNTHYDFYVRARCDFDTSKWSAWSDTLHVHLASLNINATEAVEWSLMPNPAHGSATVQCGAGIMGVDMLSVKGETVMHKDVAGEQACTLDLAGLSKGIYIVQVTTPQGTATRKLAVE